ncbi:hypothetical protein QMK33_00695 [Hymenobacter sp. H14-R3]|uniref:hypothetical protein n=1 Tax=Hymenobacter sp. H14-R3 TaxID=3046308 RepID=UPI0024BA2212|nr:hypothetical protein [Hymenobacter sp. H14-R3]MDJ0363653.1 hypothetical protein [Hymenobacter sp. H14-R3]
MLSLPPGAAETMLLRHLLPDAAALKTYCYTLRDHSGLVMPPLSALPAVPATPSLWERLSGRQLPGVPHWSTQTLAELINWVVAANYEKLLVPPLASHYEVAQAIIGITSYSSGVGVEEITLQSSFVNDLGMD